MESKCLMSIDMLSDYSTVYITWYDDNDLVLFKIVEDSNGNHCPVIEMRKGIKTNNLYRAIDDVYDYIKKCQKQDKKESLIQDLE